VGLLGQHLVSLVHIYRVNYAQDDKPLNSAHSLIRDTNSTTPDWVAKSTASTSPVPDHAWMYFFGILVSAEPLPSLTFATYFIKGGAVRHVSI
jgi:hypothetical protein